MTGHPWQSDFDVDTDSCARMVSRRFPEFADRPVRPLAEGWCFRCFLLGDDLVVKVPKRCDVVDDLEAEARLLSSLAGMLPVQVPTSVGWGEADDAFPCPIALQALVPGVPASRKGLGPEEQLRLARDALRVLDALHEIDCSEGDCLPAVWASQAMLGVSREEAHTLIERVGSHLDPQVCAALGDYYSRPPPSPSPDPPALCHGDLVPGHLVCDPGSRRLCGIIDWGDACVGDPAQDIAGLGFMLGPEELAPLLDEADGGFVERVRYRVLVAAMFALYHEQEGPPEADEQVAYRVLNAWMPRPSPHRLP